MNGSFTPYSRYNPVIIQVGAFEGYETIHLSKSHPYGSIYAFEPEIFSYSKLLENSKELKNVTALNLAVNTFSGKCLLFGKNGEGALFKSKVNQPIQEVDCITLEDWCSLKNIDRIDLLKLDINGYEYQILKNSPKVLEKTFAVVVKTFTSLNSQKNQTLSKIRLLMRSYGFELLDHQTESRLENDRKVKRGEAIFMRDYAYNPLFR
jgi:FkbM family methyltransferase